MAIAFSGQAQWKVMTYNIRNSRADDGVNNWEHRKHRLIHLIQQANPDIVGTQEVLKDQLQFLKQSLQDYSAFGVGRNNGKHAGEHSAVFYRTGQFEKLDGGNFWLSQTPKKPGSIGWDAAITRICTWLQLKERNTGQVFFVFNTHFDHKGKQARIKSAELLRYTMDSLAGNMPVVVIGDFNFTPVSEGYRTMLAPSATATLRDAYTPPAPDFTACGFEVTNNNCSRIDYIFYSRHFKCTRYTLHNENDGTFYPSDHCAVGADFVIE
ncbi:MAG: endonuclease/exonuclease/phosphatase family protein [Bacteroidetes bacterium]|nr:endonuclease/exonuclease/phosphatase family protein [Bacteroidota bacterium]MBK8659918.1 endonuclease/exonuclease/phosphatase family protein [Bacteroidota bacterium]